MTLSAKVTFNRSSNGRIMHDDNTNRNTNAVGLGFDFNNNTKLGDKYFENKKFSNSKYQLILKPQITLSPLSIK